MLKSSLPRSSTTTSSITTCYKIKLNNNIPIHELLYTISYFIVIFQDKYRIYVRLRLLYIRCGKKHWKYIRADHHISPSFSFLLFWIILILLDIFFFKFVVKMSNEEKIIEGATTILLELVQFLLTSGNFSVSSTPIPI